VRALHDLARDDDDRPWLLVVSFTHPHDPYVTRGKYWDLYEGATIPMPRIGADDVAADPHTLRLRQVSAMDEVEITDDDVRRARRAYYGNLSYLDEWTARLMGTLDSLGVADDTVVVLLADHGDMLGERGLWYKMNFFEGSARVPLIVHSPTRFPARRVADPVSLVDVLPTITELAGDGVPDSVDPLAGRSLLDLCLGPAAERSQEPSEPREVIGEYMGEGAVAPIVMIRRGELKFVHSPVDPDQLYDLAADPDERTNLAADPHWSARVKDLREEVARRWDLDTLYDQVVDDQARRRLVNAALRVGTVTPWEYTPPNHGDRQYMRNHLDLNEVERSTRFPR
jgi:choline-sulfatase